MEREFDVVEPSAVVIVFYKYVHHFSSFCEVCTVLFGEN